MVESHWATSQQPGAEMGQRDHGRLGSLINSTFVDNAEIQNEGGLYGVLWYLGRSEEKDRRGCEFQDTIPEHM